MRKMERMLIVLALVVTAAIVLTGCTSSSEEPTAVEPATEQIEEQVEEQKTSVDEVLNNAQEAVGDLAAAAGTLEARVDGLKIQSDLQQLQRELSAAAEEVGDKKIAAIEALSARFTDLIDKIEAAAAKLPEGGPVRVELEDFAQQLKDIQADLAEAAVSYEASETATP